MVGPGAWTVDDPICHAAQQEIDWPMQFGYPIDRDCARRRPPPPVCPAQPSRPAYMAAASASR